MEKIKIISLLFITIALSSTFSKSVNATNGEGKLATIYTSIGNIKIKLYDEEGLAQSCDTVPHNLGQHPTRVRCWAFHCRRTRVSERVRSVCFVFVCLLRL